MLHRFRPGLTYANVMATTAVFIALGGTAMAAVIITSNSQVERNTISGHQPPSGKHPNIIAGSVSDPDVAANSLTGAKINEASLTGDARKLIYDSGPTGVRTKIATVGPWTLKGECDNLGGSFRFALFANGPAGGANVMFSQTTDDSTDNGNHSEGFLVPANKDTVLLQSTGVYGNHFLRFAGTAMLQSGSSLVQLYFDAVADSRAPQDCFLRGTATKAT